MFLICRSTILNVFFTNLLIRRIIITDEEDVHQCGRCKEIFHSIDEYFVHKSSKVCKKPKKPPPAEPSDTSVVASNVSETQVMSRKFSERKRKHSSRMRTARLVPVSGVLSMGEGRQPSLVGCCPRRFPSLGVPSLGAGCHPWLLSLGEGVPSLGGAILGDGSVHNRK